MCRVREEVLQGGRAWLPSERRQGRDALGSSACSKHREVNASKCSELSCRPISALQAHLPRLLQMRAVRPVLYQQQW